MSAVSRQNNQPYGLEITDILDTTDDYHVTVVLKKTGKPMTIRRDQAEFYDRRMYVPYWLAKKILQLSG